MTVTMDLFTNRKSLAEICEVPDRIISVYALEQHVWEDSNSREARQARRPELQTIDEFQIDPVRPFLNDIFRNMAAPHRPERRDNPVGQGYWIQAEFGSGKSHLLCFLSSLALGNQAAWDVVKRKEQQAERGRRESLYHFWDEAGLREKSSDGKKGVFVVVKTLVGTGSGTIGVGDRGQRLVEYILDAAKEQLQLETGKNLSLYPVELLADRFLKQDLDRYQADLRKFLKDPRFFDEDVIERHDFNDFIQQLQDNRSPEYKLSCGNKLWRFYTEYLDVRPQIAAEAEEILKHFVETVLAEGYTGVLLVLDEVSMFMKNRDDNQRLEDERALVVLSNRLAKVHNLPIWTVCAAQQALESKMGVKNIIADDRLKMVELLKDDKDYYQIVLSRVREIKDPGAIQNYYLHYKRGFTWAEGATQEDFARFFPFHKPALEVLRDVTHQLTTARSAIHFMHQTLKHQVQNGGNDLIRLWELFDEAVHYEEEPSGVHAGLAAIRTTRESDYRAYEVCQRQIDAQSRGALKVYRDKAIKILQTLFLYHIASRTLQRGLTPEEIANSVLIERKPDATPAENVEHYETLAESLKKELRQIEQSVDDENRPRYRFDPVVTGVDPRTEFQKARAAAESNELMQREAWRALLELSGWPVRTRQMTLDLSAGVRSIFSDVSQKDQFPDVTWRGRQVSGIVAMRDLADVEARRLPLPPIDSDQTDRDFALYISTRPASAIALVSILDRIRDPRILLWAPAELTGDEKERLLDFAAYRKLVADWGGKDSEDAVGVINWVLQSLQTEMGKIARIVDGSYDRGRVDARGNRDMEFHVAGGLNSILEPLVERVLTAAYQSEQIKFEGPVVFKKEDGVKVINGIVKAGRIPKGAKPTAEVSAAQNFGIGLKIMKRGADRELDVSDNPFVQEIWAFVDDKLADDGQAMKVETLYKNFMGIGGPKDYGLTRRMVQVYLLCLVQQGKVRVTLGTRSGLPFPAIDYSNIAEVEFSAKVLDNLLDVQKMAQPENWEVLRPYAEKLLDETIPSTHDDAVISAFRSRLRKLFQEEKDAASRVATRAKSLFETLKQSNPYEQEVGQISALFATDLEEGNDIDLLLHGMKQALGYQAFDSRIASQQDVDDLGNRLQNYRDVQRFLSYESELRIASAYTAQALPDMPELKSAQAAQREVQVRLADLQPYIDSEVRLKTELIGRNPPVAGETGTLEVLLREYGSVYSALHDNALDRLEITRKQIQLLQNSEDLKALRVLEGISALQPPVSNDVECRLGELAGLLFTCASPSHGSVEEQLRNGPIHACGLSFHNVEQHLEAADEAGLKARKVIDEALDRKMEVFISPAVWTRLTQGEKEPLIAGLLECVTVEQVRGYLVPRSVSEPDLVEIINRYLKQISVKHVRLSNFKPSVSTVEKEQIEALVQEFHEFLERELKSIPGDDDALPMLQLE